MHRVRSALLAIVLFGSGCGKHTAVPASIALTPFSYREYTIALPVGFVLADSGGIDSIVRHWKRGSTNLYADYGARSLVGGWGSEPHPEWANVATVRSQIQGRPVEIVTYFIPDGTYGFDVVWDQLGVRRVEGMEMHVGFFIRGAATSASTRDTLLSALRSVRVH